MLVITILISVLIALILLYSWLIRRTYRKIENVLRQFTIPEKEGEPTPLYLFVDSISQAFARSVVAMAKSQLMANQSAVVRGEKAIEGDIAEDLANASSPAMAAVLGAFPTLRKTLRRNPALLNFAVQKLMSMGGNKNNGQPAITGKSSQAEFNL